MMRPGFVETRLSGSGPGGEALPTGTTRRRRCHLTAKHPREFDRRDSQCHVRTRQVALQGRPLGAGGYGCDYLAQHEWTVPVVAWATVGIVSRNARVTDSDAGYSTTRQPTTPKSSSRACRAQTKAVFVGGVAWNDTVTVRASTSSKPVSSNPTSSAEFEKVNHESAATDAAAVPARMIHHARRRAGCDSAAVAFVELLFCRHTVPLRDLDATCR